jgi:hypothetical protein
MDVCLFGKQSLVTLFSDGPRPRSKVNNGQGANRASAEGLLLIVVEPGGRA